MGVEFNEPTLSSGRPLASMKGTFFERFIIKTGLVKSPRVARIVLIILSIAMLAGAVYLIVPSTTPAPTPNPADYPVWPS